MLNDLLIFSLALLVVARSASLATQYASNLAESFGLSKYIMGFVVVAVISILPETFIAINSSLQGVPALGLSTLYGSNVADLTLIFALIVLIAGRGIKIESEVFKNNRLYPFVLLLPVVLGLDGSYTRLEGLALIISGIIFYISIFKDSQKSTLLIAESRPSQFRNSLFLALSMAAILAGAYLVVKSSTELAHALGISPALIGLAVVSIGTTMPELFFSLKSRKKHKDSLAVGDILGTVLTDATIVIGILALINPFSFPVRIVYVTGVFMVLSSVILVYFMRTGKFLSKDEALALLGLYATFIFVQFVVNL